MSNDYALPDDRRCVDGCIKLQFQVEVKSGIRQGEELPTNCTESRREETRDDTCIFHTLTSIHHRFSISQTRSRCIASRFWRMRIQWPVIMCVDCSAELQLQVKVGRWKVKGRVPQTALEIDSWMPRLRESRYRRDRLFEGSHTVPCLVCLASWVSTSTSAYIYIKQGEKEQFRASEKALLLNEYCAWACW